MSTGVTYQYLESRPASLYRQLFIKGTRIRAELIYWAHINAGEPRTAEEIAADIAREEAIMAATGQSDPDYKYHPHRKPLTPEQWARLLS